MLSENSADAPVSSPRSQRAAARKPSEAGRQPPQSGSAATTDAASASICSVPCGAEKGSERGAAGHERLGVTGRREVFDVVRPPQCRDGVSRSTPRATPPARRAPGHVRSSHPRARSATSGLVVEPSLVVRLREFPDEQLGGDGEIPAGTRVLDRVLDRTGRLPTSAPLGDGAALTVSALLLRRFSSSRTARNNGWYRNHSPSASSGVMNRLAATNDSRIAAEFVESRTASHSDGQNTSRIAVRWRKLDVSAGRSDNTSDRMKSETTRSGTAGPAAERIHSSSSLAGEREQDQTRRPTLGPLEELSDPLGRDPHSSLDEEGFGLGLVECQVGCSELEYLATHAPSPTCQPDLPATRDGHLDPGGQEIQEQVDDVTALERVDLVQVVQHQHEWVVDAIDRRHETRHDLAEDRGSGSSHVLEQGGIDRPDPGDGAADRSHQRDAVVVVPIERHPGEGSAVMSGPIGEQCRLAEANGGGDDDQWKVGSCGESGGQAWSVDGRRTRLWNPRLGIDEDVVNLAGVDSGTHGHPARYRPGRGGTDVLLGKARVRVHMNWVTNSHRTCRRMIYVGVFLIRR